LAVAVAISKKNPNKPMKGQFWRGEEVKRIRGALRAYQEEASGKEASEEG